MQSHTLPDNLPSRNDLHLSTAHVTERRFHYDYTLFLMGRVLQSLPVFHGLYNDREAAVAAIQRTLDGISFQAVVGSLQERDAALTRVYEQLIDNIRCELGAQMAMSDFYSLGQMDLLYRHRNNAPQNMRTETGIQIVDTLLNVVECLLSQDISEERGKPSLAAEIFNPTMPHWTDIEFTYENKTIREITKAEKFYSDTYYTLTENQLQEYRNLLDPSQTKPFWFSDLSLGEQRYILAMLENMRDENVGNFNKNINDFFGNTSAKGRKLPGLAGLRRKTIWLYEKKSDSGYTLIDIKQPDEHHFTSAGSPVHLTTGISQEQVGFAADNIARMLSVIVDRRREWLKDNFHGRAVGMEAIYLVITSLVSPLSGQAKLADSLAEMLQGKTGDILKENNEEMIVRVLKRAVDHINNLAARGELCSLNQALDQNIENNIICDLAIISINKFRRIPAWFTSRKSLYQTGPMTAFHALIYDIQLFINHGEETLPKATLQAIYKNLTELDFNHGIAYLNSTVLQLLGEQQVELNKCHDPKMKKLARRIKAALIFVEFAQRSDMNIIAAAIFEKINPGTTYEACKSSHDRKEHKDMVSEAIDIAEQLLGYFPDPTNATDMWLLSQIFFNKKYFVQGAVESRALSANNIGLKSHDSGGVFESYWRNMDGIFLRYEEFSKKLTAGAIQGDFPAPSTQKTQGFSGSCCCSFSLSSLKSGWDYPISLAARSDMDSIPIQKIRQALYALVQYEKKSLFSCPTLREFMLVLLWIGMVYGVSYDRLNPEHFIYSRDFDTAIVCLSLVILWYFRSVVDWVEKSYRSRVACDFINQGIPNQHQAPLMNQPLVELTILTKDGLINVFQREFFCSLSMATHLLNKYFRGTLNSERSMRFPLMKWIGLVIKYASYLFLDGLLAYACLAFVSALSHRNLALAFPIAVLVFLYSLHQHRYFVQLSEKCSDQVASGGMGPKILKQSQGHHIYFYKPEAAHQKLVRDSADRCSFSV